MKKIEKNRLIPLFYHDDIKMCEEVLNVINRCNLPVLEFTNLASNAIDNFNRLINSSENSEIYLGAGSIKSDNEAKVFIDLGASFIVSPLTPPALIRVLEPAPIILIFFLLSSKL